MNRYLEAIINKVRFDPRAAWKVRSGHALAAYWSSSSETVLNFGDAINPLVLTHLSGREVVHVSRVAPYLRPPTLYGIGSILDNLKNPKSVVLGSGFKSQKARLRAHPLAVAVVRGPLTKGLFEQHGVKCPERFCDPGLVVSQLFPHPRKNQGYIGIVPHYADKSIVARWQLNPERHRIIDIESRPEDFIAALSECSHIVSSSLHGIIAAHAYGLPAVWMKISANVVGDGFKFADYLLSVGCNNPSYVEIGSLGEGIDQAKASWVPDVDKRIAQLYEGWSEAEYYLSRSVAEG